MNYFCIHNLIQVEVSDSYPWVETLFLNGDTSLKADTPFSGCTCNVKIEKVSKLDLSDVRSIGDEAYIGSDVYVDGKYGVRIERKSKHSISMTVTQECNEWLIICVELLLLSMDKTLVHAAGLEKDGEVILLPSWGGVGKTATVCKFVQNYGWRLLGDDLIIVDENSALPFLKPFVIYPYHKNLFPQLFESKNGSHTVKNLKMSAWMSKIIPTVKRLTRPFPKLLAFLRKHNPQSMRVSPTKIFTKEQLSSGGKIKKSVWLERCVGAEPEYRSCTSAELASKACTVTSVEIFSEKLNGVFHMGGCGMFSYDETVGKIHGILGKLFENAECDVLEIPVQITIEQVGDLVYKNVME